MSKDIEDDEDYSSKIATDQERNLEIRISEVDKTDESYNNDMSLNTDRYAL